jgi:membrane-associated phospholipid phosphatase
MIIVEVESVFRNLIAPVGNSSGFTNLISWWTITRLGDSAILLPAALIIALWLLVGRAWKMAFSWCLLFGFAMIIVIATKLAFIGWGIGSASLDFTGVSGHAARATAIFPVLFYLSLQGKPRKINSIVVVLGYLLGLVITVSRVIVHAHSISEAISGCVLGSLVSLIFLWVANDQAISIRRRWLLVPSFIFLMATPYVKPAPAQEWITTAALYLSNHDRPFDRAMWHH